MGCKKHFGINLNKQVFHLSAVKQNTLRAFPAIWISYCLESANSFSCFCWLCRALALDGHPAFRASSDCSVCLFVIKQVPEIHMVPSHV